ISSFASLILVLRSACSFSLALCLGRSEYIFFRAARRSSAVCAFLYSASASRYCGVRLAAMAMVLYPVAQGPWLAATRGRRVRLGRPGEVLDRLSSYHLHRQRSSNRRRESANPQRRAAKRGQTGQRDDEFAIQSSARASDCCLRRRRAPPRQEKGI